MASEYHAARRAEKCTASQRALQRSRHSVRSLFEVHAAKLAALKARHGADLPWYVMTSEATDAPTRDFFGQHDHFGLDPSCVTFFVQGMLPVVDAAGKLLLESPGRICQAL